MRTPGWEGQWKPPHQISLIESKDGHFKEDAALKDSRCIRDHGTERSAQPRMQHVFVIDNSLFIAFIVQLDS